MSVSIRVDGTWLNQIGPWDGLQWITRWDDGASGMWEATWRMSLPRGFTHKALRPGAEVELIEGNKRIGSSLQLREPERSGDQWDCTAVGYARVAEGRYGALALDASGASTDTPSVAVDEAIARGALPWAGRGDLGPLWTDPVATEAGTLNTVATLLTQMLTEAGFANPRRWYVDADNIARYTADPTEPTLYVIPTTGRLSIADDDYITRVAGRYLRSSDSTYQTVTADTGDSRVREHGIDLTILGPITAAKAQTIVDDFLLRTAGRPSWGDPLELRHGEIRGNGGQAIDLAGIQAGQMVRLWGQSGDILPGGTEPYTDIIIGQTTYADGADTITIAPLGLADRSLQDVLETIMAAG